MEELKELKNKQYHKMLSLQEQIIMLKDERYK